jgi:hypothetical protein
VSLLTTCLSAGMFAHDASIENHCVCVDTWRAGEDDDGVLMGRSILRRANDFASIGSGRCRAGMAQVAQFGHVTQMNFESPSVLDRI